MGSEFRLCFHSFVWDSKKKKKPRQTKELLKSTQKSSGIFVTIVQSNEKYFNGKYLNL